MEFSELAELIKSRRSIRQWQDKPVPEDLLLKAIELATWAPNGANQQNWRFYVILDRTVIQKIADEVQKITDLMFSWPETRELGKSVAHWKTRNTFFKTAPAAIAIASSRYQSVADKILAAREASDPEAEKIRGWRNTANSRIQSVASATAYLLLILHQMGLGAVWMTGPTQAKEPIERILGIPKNLDFISFIPVGYPAEIPEELGRRPVTEVTGVIRRK